jgi:Arc/MetJ-type ribon-helix-helix transcriptional regulator
MVIQELELSALVKAGIFRNKTEAIKEALRSHPRLEYWQKRVTREWSL